jgi:cell wall-associated NlpC family hydrolase
MLVGAPSTERVPRAVPGVSAKGAPLAIPGLATAQIALEYAGAPYVYGGDGPSGFDCSGFVQFITSRAGRVVPRDLYGQYNAGSHPESLEPGDLVFFRDTYESGLSHSGIYVGNGQFIHAISEERGVGVSNLNEPYYAERWYGATRLP